MGDVLAVGLLLQHTANVNACNSYGRSPVMLASMFGHLEITKELAESRALPNECDVWGFSAVAWAEQRSHRDLAWHLRLCGATSSLPKATGLCCAPTLAEAVEDVTTLAEAVDGVTICTI